ncbi:hypothetical protein CXB51_015603 [Gossypium anomalum]|uniref:Uncharacterized protein n=1 Tax=Gossypium anomalum TaxID=47600 RepID=A0A8J5YHY5_9ROSI|nr:hypothetical protein CXB51_015603 [Gossypium anomalum]
MLALIPSTVQPPFHHYDQWMMSMVVPYVQGVYGVVLLTWRGRLWGVTRSLLEALLFGVADGVCGAWE